MAVFTTINPATEEPLEQYAWHAHAQVDHMVARAASAQQAWVQRPLQHRLDVIRQLGVVLHAHADQIAHMITTEMGKPIVQARAEAEKCVTVCDYYADHAEDVLAELPVATAYTRSSIRFDPLGVVLSIMPWNFPF